MKKALITGITGQDGSYLAEFLLEKGYKVYGLKRRTVNMRMENIEHIINEIELIDGDIMDMPSLSNAVKTSMPDEVYNFAAQSFVQTSWKQPYVTTQINSVGAMSLLDAIRVIKPDVRFYQASTSEMFGNVQTVPQNEDTPFYPRSPYGVSKLYAHWITVNYRESYDMFACSGILFNHESPRRGLEFVTRKVTMAAAMIKAGHIDRIGMGRLDVKRDWGFAGDYVEAMWLMLQNDKPRDYVIASGKAHSVEEMAKIAFEYVGLDHRDHIYLDKQYLRPAEVTQLVGDATRAEKELGWKPKIGFRDLIEMMVESDLRKLRDQ
jgi:GDPmannose 4,6-dehydratase